MLKLISRLKVSHQSSVISHQERHCAADAVPAAGLLTDDCVLFSGQ